MKKREVKNQKQEQNGHKKGARNKRGGGEMGFGFCAFPGERIN